MEKIYYHILTKSIHSRNPSLQGVFNHEHKGVTWSMEPDSIFQTKCSLGQSSSHLSVTTENADI